MTKILYVLSSIMLIVSLVTLIFVSLPPAKSVFVPNEQIIPESKDKIDLTCKNSSDCQIKNVGNQCGYYPMCVNKNFQPNPPELDSMICGFPSIENCQCVKSQCQGL